MRCERLVSCVLRNTLSARDSGHYILFALETLSSAQGLDLECTMIP